MIRRKILALALTAITVISASGFAFADETVTPANTDATATTASQTPNTYGKHFAGGFHKDQNFDKGGNFGGGFGRGAAGMMGFMGGNKDPQKMLESTKANIQERVTDGKITQVQADKMISQLEQKIKDMEAFNSMTPQQKKDKLLGDFTNRMNKEVESKKTTQDKVDKAIADYKAKLDKWDGNGFQPMVREGNAGEKNRSGIMQRNVDPQKNLDNAKVKLQKAVTDGKMTQQQADESIAKIQKCITDMQAFKNMTLEQKKDSLLSKFTDSINLSVKNNKITQDKADKAIADYKVKIDKWDGTGFLPFGGGKGLQGEKHHKTKDIQPVTTTSPAST